MKPEEKDLDALREGIDTLDENIIELLAERFVIAAKIGNIKKNLDIDVVDSIREKALLDKLSEKAKSSGLREEFIHNLWAIVLKESHQMQNNILGEKD